MKTIIKTALTKSSAGIERSIQKPVTKRRDFTDGGVILIMSNILQRPVEAKFLESGIEVEKADLDEMEVKLKEIKEDYSKFHSILSKMNSLMNTMGESIKLGNFSIGLDAFKEYMGYYYWVGGTDEPVKILNRIMIDKLKGKTREEFKKIFFDLITLDQESYTFTIVKDFHSDDSKKVFDKHPFLSHLENSNVDNVPQVLIKEKRDKRKNALEKLEKELPLNDYLEIKKWSDLINEQQVMLESKNYYWPKMSAMINKVYPD